MKNILIKITLGIICFWLGIYFCQNRYEDQTQKIEQLQTALDTCKTTCAEEFEKMGC